MQRITTAEKKSSSLGRKTRIVGVAKKQTILSIKNAIQNGLEIIGENYAQELSFHYEALKESPLRTEWHFIGPLQKNKIKKIIPYVNLIHSVDRIEIGKEIQKRCSEKQKKISILLQLNISNESSKSGINENEIPSFLEVANQWSFITLKGLMTMPPPTDNPESSRIHFKRCREIRNAINSKRMYKSALTELSMGTSQDFEVAIEEGATLVRLGSVLFGERIE